MAPVRNGIAMVFAASLFIVGCGGNELDGTWTTNLTGAGSAAKLSVDLADDGTATITEKVTEFLGVSCTGQFVYSGYKWTSGDSTITFSGDASCKTSVVCQQTPAPCSPQKNVLGTCQYKLENNDNSLEISNCTNGSNAGVTYVRVQ